MTRTKASEELQRFNQPADDATPAKYPEPTARFEMDAEDYVEGTQDLTREDMQIPQLILVQAQSKNIADHMQHIGQFYNNLTGEFYADVNAVLLSESKGRVAFPRDFSADSEPLCGSDDALTPRAEYEGTEVTDPKTGFTQFGADGESPMCAKSYSFAMLDALTGIPFVLRAQRTATQAAKQLNTIAKTMGRRKYIKIASRLVESDKGTYYVPTFATNGETEPELKKFALKYSLEVGNLSKRVALSDGAVKQITSGVPDENPDIPF
jgi:hypothetical protein